MTRKILLLVALLAFGSLSACYKPEPAEGAFTCSPDLGGLCPGGMICSKAGFCILPGSLDLGTQPLDLAGDQAVPETRRTCDERVAQGAFTGLVALAALNTAGDEEHIAYDPTSGGHRLVFVRGNQLFSAAISNSDGKSVSAPVAVTLTAAPAGIILRGGSFGSDGKYWFAGTVAGTTSLYSATRVDATTFTVAAAQAPATSCAFSDPFLMQGDPMKELYLGYPLAGCAGAPYVATGAVGLNIGAFYSSLPEPNWTAPSLTSTGLLLLTSSTGADRHLYASARSGAAFQFANANRIVMPTGIAESTEDRQAVVSTDCSTIYFSSVRSGGAGGADLFAASIAAE